MLSLDLLLKIFMSASLVLFAVTKNQASLGFFTVSAALLVLMAALVQKKSEEQAEQGKRIKELSDRLDQLTMDLRMSR